MRFLKILAALVALMGLGACSNPMAIQSGCGKIGVCYDSVSMQVRGTGGPVVNGLVGRDMTTGQIVVHNFGSGYSTGQTVSTTLAGSIPQAMGIAAGGALTRPSNISMVQGGAVANARGGSAHSGSFSQGGSARVTNDVSASSASSSSSSSAAAACGSFYGC